MTHRHVGCDFFAGWISGIAGIIVGQPLDTIKTYQQIYTVKTGEAVRLIHEKVGLKGFYRGMTVPLLTSGILNSLFFGGYGATLKFIDSNRNLFMNTESIATLKNSETYKLHHGSYFEVFIAGCVAGLIQMPISCPSELVKVRCQAAIASANKKTSFCVVREIYKEQGIPGFSRGAVAMFWRDVPSSGLFILTYVLIKDYLSLWTGRKTNTVHQFIAGGLAGSMSWVFVIPFDTVKSQMQATSLKKEGISITTIMKSILRKRGVVGLTRGTIPISLRAFPVNGVTFLAYEKVYRYCTESVRKQTTTVTNSNDQSSSSQTPKTQPSIQCFNSSQNNTRSCACRKL